MYEQEWVQLIQFTHVAINGTTFGNIPVFLFLYVSEKKNRRTAFF